MGKMVVVHHSGGSDPAKVLIGILLAILFFAFVFHAHSGKGSPVAGQTAKPATTSAPKAAPPAPKPAPVVRPGGGGTDWVKVGVLEGSGLLMGVGAGFVVGRAVRRYRRATTFDPIANYSRAYPQESLDFLTKEEIEERLR